MKLLLLEYMESLENNKRMKQQVQDKIDPLERIYQDKHRFSDEERAAAKLEAEEWKLERSVLNGMESDLQYSIEWMKTGRKPDSYRGAENRKAYEQNSFPPSFFQELPMYEDLGNDEKEDDFKAEYLEFLLKDLTYQEREIFVLTRLGYSVRQAAQVLDLKKSKVHLVKSRAEKKVEKRAGVRISKLSTEDVDNCRYIVKG